MSSRHLQNLADLTIQAQETARTTIPVFLATFCARSLRSLVLPGQQGHTKWSQWCNSGPCRACYCSLCQWVSGIHWQISRRQHKQPKQREQSKPAVLICGEVSGRPSQVAAMATDSIPRGTETESVCQWADPICRHVQICEITIHPQSLQDHAEPCRLRGTATIACAA